MPSNSNLTWISSRHLDRLSERLAESLKDTPSSDIFEKEIILVQSQGMQRYISFRLAEQLGVAFNIDFRFPRDFINSVFATALPERDRRPAATKTQITFAIMSILPSLAKERAEFIAVKNFLGSDDSSDDLKLYQLSSRIADLFDQYCTFRPEMILKWENKEYACSSDTDEIWQSVLWREISGYNDNISFAGNFAALERQLAEALAGGTLKNETLPRRISVFGISYMPFEFFNVLHAISEYCEVRIYQMNPCREYWADIVDFRNRQRLSNGISLDDCHYEEGNRLLASLGKSARDWINFLIESEAVHYDLDEGDEESRDTLLHSIQTDIHTLSQNNQAGRQFNIKDNSILIQSCHSPMRETEVLRDHILELLNSGHTAAPENIFSGLNTSSMKPEDILVMIPDIAAYTPCIEAVFKTPVVSGSDSFIIPYNISDKSMRTDAAAADLLLSILRMRHERFRAAAVLNILESPALNSSVCFSPDELALIREWISDTRIRWGFDSEEKKELGLAPEPQNTWQSALDRLMMSYALDHSEEDFCFDILSYPGVSASEGTTLGKITVIINTLRDTIKRFGQALTLQQWEEEITQTVNFFIEDNFENSQQISFIHQAMNELALMETNGIYTGRTDIDVIEEYLSSALSESVSQHGFMKSGVTFCSVLPMRTIPFRAICMMGMNHDAFPRRQVQPGFDIMGKHYKPGDRSRRFDDRYQFLETLMSARDIFYISYTGRNIKDDSEIPPSVVVSELIDYIADNYSSGMGGPEIIRKLFVTHHRLHSFSRDYFNSESENLFSYSSSAFSIAESLSAVRKDYTPFCTAPLPIPPGEHRLAADESGRLRITLDDLIYFFKNPSRYFLNNRLGIYLNGDTEETLDSEIFVMDNLELYQLRDRLLNNIIGDGGSDLSKTFRVKNASGSLPHGNYGKLLFDKTAEDISVFAENVRQHINLPNESVSFTLSFRQALVECSLDNIYDEILLRYRPAKIKAADRLRLWIELAALRSTGAEVRGVLIGKNKGNAEIEEFRTGEDPEKIIECLLQYFIAGIKMPLPFFPESSLSCFIKYSGQQDLQSALSSAADKWSDSFAGRAECEDAYFSFCFGKSDPFNQLFADIAAAIYSPMLASKTEK